VERSTAVLAGLQRFYGAIEANDAAAFDEVVSMGEATLVIGTAPGEFVRERERLEAGFRTEGYRLQGGPNPEAFQEGALGWVVDEPILNMPDGTAIRTRLTAILVKGDDRWRVVHAHFSVGVPDDEVALLQRRWGDSPGNG
jgi:ketosteroid isomerase-like protein